MSKYSGSGDNVQCNIADLEHNDCMHRNVVDLARYIKPSAARSFKVPAAAECDLDLCSAIVEQNAISDTTPEANSNAGQPLAIVLPLKKEREFLASVEIDWLLAISTEHHHAGVEGVIAEVGKLLRAEFGPAAVRRETRLFSVAHDDFEELVAGILRVQFYSNRIELPEYNVFGEKTEQCGVTLTWGVGRYRDEATGERKKKKRFKEQRRLRRG